MKSIVQKLSLGLSLFVLSTQGLQATGVTVITHGFDSNVDLWIDSMADAIALRAGGLDHVSQYTLVMIHDPPQVRVASFTRDENSPAIEELSNAEIIVKACWAQSAGESLLDGLFCDTLSTDVVGQLLAAALTTPNAATDRSLPYPLAQLPLHLIGHSRGASVMASAAKSLGENGIWVDQLTTLDPKPLLNCGDPQVLVYQNVFFADNYYQTQNLLSGQPISGAVNRHLVFSNGGYTDLIAAHSNVHLWYFGTINTQPLVFNGQVWLTSLMRQSWYSQPEAGGQKAGFYFSRLGDGPRDSQAPRVALMPEGAQWPQLRWASEIQEPLVLGVPTVTKLLFQDADSQVSISLLLDSDRNPYNNQEERVLLTSTELATVLFEWTAPIQWNIGLEGQYLYAKISDGTQERYAYQSQPLVLDQESLPVGFINPEWTSEDAFALQLVGPVGGEFRVEYSEDLQEWHILRQFVSQQIISDVVDSAASQSAKRFYRAQSISMQ